MSNPLMDGFCLECGAILPPATTAPSTVKCHLCGLGHTISPITSRLVYHTEKSYIRTAPEAIATQGHADGPEVEHRCSHCGNATMCYSTRQTRSADEGLTVFYTCPRCGNKEIEYS